jgi:hypothetical protein
MAGVAGDACAVHVGRIALVSLVHIGLGVAGAIRARKRRIGTRGIGVASRAKATRIVVIHVPKIVSKRRPKPRRGQGCVARRASRWSDPDDGGVGGKVIRHGPAHRLGALPLSGVATVAVGRRLSGAGVAKVARRSNVQSDQWKSGRAVVKDRARPGSRRMARVARLWIRQGHVVWSWRDKGRGNGA